MYAETADPIKPARSGSKPLNRLFLLLTLGAFSVAVACGGPDAVESNAAESNALAASETSEAPATSDTSALDAPSSSVEAVVEPVALEPVFSRDVLPTIQASCVACHAAGQAGSDDLVLATAGDVRENIETIRLYTSSRVMPPWPASHQSLPFVGDYSLSQEQIEAIAAWDDDGAELDVDSATPLVSSRIPSILEDPEIVMTSAGGAFTGSTEQPDDYRCLIFEPGNTEREWIRGTQFLPDQTEIVHHGIITLASTELRDQAAWLDDSQPGPGWTCYGGTGLRTNEGGRVLGLGGWAPGAQAARQPDGFAIALDPGDFVVVQIHYHYDDAAPADLSSFALDLASDEEIAEVGGSFEQLRADRYLGPAEIPCYEGDTDPLCDRSVAVERVRSLFGDIIGGLPDYFLWNCGAKVEDFAHMTNGSATSTCDLPVTNPGRIMTVSGHMHELGQSIRLTLNPDTPEERILLDIPDWDFEWQLGYRPVEDIVIDAGDIIRVDCAWNRERAPYDAVGYIVWSDGTGDEMCFSTVTTAPVG